MTTQQEAQARAWAEEFLSAMWVPASAGEIEAAASGGELSETSSFDVKEALPPRTQNASLAVDVAAMSTDGGVLLYGVAEDDDQRPTTPSPIPLAGARERVDQIVQTSIVEAPYIVVHEYPTDDNPSVGYLLVVVPLSPRAPHQVSVRGDLRFYGRGASGNKILTEGEIARLYRRREEWEQDQDVLLANAIAAAPFGPIPDFGFMHGFARPVAREPGLWNRAEERSGGRAALTGSLSAIASQPRTKEGYDPTLHGGRWRRVGAEAWRLSTIDEHEPDPRWARATVSFTTNRDGSGHLFCGRAAERISRHSSDDGRLVIFESIIAGNLAGFFAFLAALYQAAGYHGHVDLGVAVIGLEGGWSSRTISAYGPGFYPFTAPNYSRTARVAAAELEQPTAVAKRLLRDLFDATTGQHDFDPFV